MKGLHIMRVHLSNWLVINAPKSCILARNSVGLPCSHKTFHLQSLAQVQHMKERIVLCLQLTYSLLASTRQSDFSSATAAKALDHQPYCAAQKLKALSIFSSAS